MIWNPERREPASGPFSAACYFLVLSFTLAPAAAQQYTISTIAGGGGGAALATPSRGVNLFIGAVHTLATDAAGNLYFAAASSIYKLDQNGIVTRVAGASPSGYSGDGEPATNAQLSRLFGVAVDAAGNLFIVDGVRVRRVAPSGTIATVAGNGAQGYSGDGGPAVNAQFGNAGAIAVDGMDNLFIADTGNNSVRKVSSIGIISTVAGNRTAGFSGDGGPATKAQLSAPSGLAVDNSGNLYIADYVNLRVRKVSTNGIITTVAGNGGSGFSGDGGAAINATFLGPQGVALDSAGNLYIADCDCYEDGSGAYIRKVSPSGIITTVAGNGTCCFSGDLQGLPHWTGNP
jgi:hypothetical protein